MGDRLQVGKPSPYVTSHSGQLSLAIPLWVGAMSTSESWDVNGRTARCSSLISVVSQCKLVSGWGLKKQRSAPTYGPSGSGRTLRLRLVHVVLVLLHVSVPCKTVCGRNCADICRWLVVMVCACCSVCTCAVRNCLECRYRQQCTKMSTSVQPAIGDQLSPIQALIAGVQTPPRPSEPLAEHASVTTLYLAAW